MKELKELIELLLVTIIVTYPVLITIIILGFKEIRAIRKQIKEDINGEENLRANRSFTIGGTGEFGESSRFIG